ncbi:MAG: hypothetical protein ABW063_02850 [Caulobacter sp.]
MDPEFETSPWPLVVVGLIGGGGALAAYLDGRPALTALVCVATLASMVIVHRMARDKD